MKSTFFKLTTYAYVVISGLLVRLYEYKTLGRLFMNQMSLLVICKSMKRNTSMYNIMSVRRLWKDEGIRCMSFHLYNFRTAYAFKYTIYECNSLPCHLAIGQEKVSLNHWANGKDSLSWLLVLFYARTPVNPVVIHLLLRSLFLMALEFSSGNTRFRKSSFM